MKYAKFWEFRPEDMDEAVAVWRRISKKARAVSY